jgi:hypothetical protein
LKEQETQSMEGEESSKGVARYCSLLPCLTCLIVDQVAADNSSIFLNLRTGASLLSSQAILSHWFVILF